MNNVNNLSDQYGGREGIKKYLSHTIARITSTHASLSDLNSFIQEYYIKNGNKKIQTNTETTEESLKTLFDNYVHKGQNAVEESLDKWSDKKILSVSEQTVKEFNNVYSYLLNLK